MHRIGMQMYKYYHKTVPIVIRYIFDDYTHIHHDRENILGIHLENNNICIAISASYEYTSGILL